jgi:hypothetical protein
MTSECEVMAAELVAYLDGEQPEADRARIEGHVATCLTCRREMDRIGKVNALLRSLPRIEPSADFDARMWQRLEAETARRSRRRGFRPAMWGIPLAAAAALALVWYSSLSQPTPGSLARPGHVGTVANAPKDVARSVHEVEAVARAKPEEPADAAPIEQANADLAPEDLPPELIEHPELFLRLPVVRRLDKLEHFEEVRTPDAAEPIGQGEPSARALG